MLVKRKRLEALEGEVTALRERLEELSALLSEERKREEREKASIAQTMNEWVWGKESENDE